MTEKSLHKEPATLILSPNIAYVTHRNVPRDPWIKSTLLIHKWSTEIQVNLSQPCQDEKYILIVCETNAIVPLFSGHSSFILHFQSLRVLSY